MDGRRQKGRVTREKLVAVAADLFARLGYDATPIDAVLRESGASRGALYHHFADKKALFEAVLRHVHAGAVQSTIDAARGSSDGVEALKSGCVAWIRLAGEPAIRQIVLIDAPSVVGWERWRQIDEEHSFGVVKAGLGAAARRGLMPEALIAPMSHIVLATLNELALMIAAADDPARAEKAALAALDHLFQRLFDRAPG